MIRMKPKLPFHLLAAAALALAACSPDSAVPASGEIAPSAPAGDRSAFDREVIRIKSEEPDPARREARFRDLVRKHGFPVPEASSATGAGEAAAPAALAKSAALYPVQVKTLSGNRAWAYHRTVTVPAGGTLRAEASGYSACDPFLVAYYQTSGDAQAGLVTFVMAEDDNVVDTVSPPYEETDPDAYWTNATGSSQAVTVVVFASSPSLTGDGMVTLKDHPTSGSILHSAGNIPMLAAPAYDNSQAIPTLPEGCSAVDFSRINGRAMKTTDFLAYDNTTGKGGRLNSSSNNHRRVTLESRLPSGSPNFLLAYAATSSKPTVTISGTWSAWQEDAVECE